MRKQVGVIGSAGTEEYGKEYTYKQGFINACEKTGELLAKEGFIVVQGGKGGLMQAVAKGAKKAGGLVISVVDGCERGVSNEYTDIELVTGMTGKGSDAVLPLCCDALIALGGGSGTLNEICVAYKNKKLIILLKGYGSWTDILANQECLDERKTVKFEIVNTPEEAVSIVSKKLKGCDK